MDKLIQEKIPEVANIETESFTVAPNKKETSLFSKLQTMLEFLIRGNGTSIDEYYMNKSEVIQEFISFINLNPQDWFHKLFKLENIKINKDIVINEPKRITVRIWELKALIDCLENKDYLDF